MNKTCPKCGETYAIYLVGCPNCVLSNKQNSYESREKEKFRLQILRIVNYIFLPVSVLVGLIMIDVDPRMKKILPVYLVVGQTLVYLNYLSYKKVLKNSLKDQPLRSENALKKFNNSFLWFVWFCLILLLIVAKMLFISLTNEQLFVLFNLYAFLSFVPTIMLSMLKTYKIIGYVNRFHQKKYQILLSSKYYSTNRMAATKNLKFIFSAEDFDDQVLGKLKNELKCLLLLLTLIFLTIIPLFSFVMKSQ